MKTRLAQFLLTPTSSTALNLFYIMFGFLKSILGRSASSPTQNPPLISPKDQAVSKETLTASAGRANDTSSAGRNGTGNGNGHNTGHSLALPLQPIIAALPLELQTRVKQQNVGDLTIAVSLDKILSQLAHGAVRIAFGEIRQAAPHVFLAAPEMDRVLVTLPLSEVLPRINPSLIKRRRVQKVVEVPDDISSPFDEQGRGLMLSSKAGHAEVASKSSDTSFSRTNASSVRPAAPTGGTPISLNRSTGPAPQVPGAPSALPLPSSHLTPSRTPEPTKPEPAKPANAPIKMPETGFLRKAAQGDTAPPHPVAPAPTAPPGHGTQFFSKTPSTLGGNGNGNGGNQTPAGNGNGHGNGNDHGHGSGTQATPQGAPTTPVQSAPALTLPLAHLAEAWPEAVRKEIVQLNLVDAKVALPREVLERALKQGRIAFTWRMLRSWIRPTPLPTVSAQDGAVLELPLKIIAPLFLARGPHAKQPQAKVEIDEEIPNLFFGFPQGESNPGVAAQPAKPVDTNYYVWDDRSDMVRVGDSDAKTGPSAGTKFISKYATPNEIISRAGALDGVAGALIALPDGLLVASEIPPDFNGDTLAAFLPQIFGKVSSCTKELRMGDLNNLNFTVGNVPWKIFRVNAIFFAAFGKPGEALPTAQLAALAAELDHKPKTL